MFPVGNVRPFLQSRDFRLGVDVEQALPQHLHLGPSDGFGGGHQLPVDVAGADHIVVDDGQLAHAAAHEPFGTPAANAADPEKDHARLLKCLENLVSYQ